MNPELTQKEIKEAEGFNEVLVKEESKFINLPCKTCGKNQGNLWREPEVETRKFLICADGYHAICCECGYRVQIPQSKPMEVKQNGKVK